MEVVLAGSEHFAELVMLFEVNRLSCFLNSRRFPKNISVMFCTAKEIREREVMNPPKLEDKFSLKVIMGLKEGYSLITNRYKANVIKQGKMIADPINTPGFSVPRFRSDIS